MKRLLVVGCLLVLCRSISAQELPRPKLRYEPTPSSTPYDYLPRTTKGMPTARTTGEPELLKQAPAPIPDLTTLTDNGDSAIPMWARISLRGDAGDGVGYKRGFSSLEAMIPVMESQSRLLFANLRVVNFMDEDRWEYNVGGGYRWHSQACNVVFGINSFYDMRKTDYHFYQQAGVGFEALTPWLEFRANGYFIVGPAHRTVSDTGFVNTGIVVNNNFVLQRSQQTEIALTGAEAEIGGRLPFLDRFAPKAFAGYYTYSAEGIAVTHGVRGRFEAQVNERISLHAQVQHDYLFGTTFTGGIAFHLGAPAYRTGNRGATTWTDVLRQPVHRDVNIVITESTTNSTGTQPLPKPKVPDPT